jgi:methionyl aminopeptidase
MRSGGELVVVELKTDEALEGMRAAGRVVARIRAAARDAAAVGVSLLELDEVARGVLEEAGAGSPFLNYRPPFAPTPFPGVICASVNDAVVHGIPDSYRLRDGDLVSIDAGAELDGWTGDAATRRALDAGIAAAVAGRRLGDISHAIGLVADEVGAGMPADFGGHGIGRRMHEDPHVPNRGRAGRGYPLRPGLTLAIEPMFMAGGRNAYRTDRDGWTLRTTDGSRAAHLEHTIAITPAGPRILTAP